MSEQSVAHLVIDALKRSGIDQLFCIPGVQNDDFFNALVDAPEIRPIVTRHEQGAAYMAMGAAQVTGKPAACCVVPGPGMLNASGALTSAYWGYARVLAVIGQIATSQQGRHFGALHDLPDQTAILRQLTKHTAVVHDPATAEPRSRTRSTWSIRGCLAQSASRSRSTSGRNPRQGPSLRRTPPCRALTPHSSRGPLQSLLRPNGHYS